MLISKQTKGGYFQRFKNSNKKLSTRIIYKFKYSFIINFYIILIIYHVMLTLCDSIQVL